MKIVIEIGSLSDVDELELLYNDLNDYLSTRTNYPGWLKGVYPVRENAVVGINNKNLYVAKYAGKIVGSVILSHEPEDAYHEIKWDIDTDYINIFVVHTFVVHPDFLKAGIGKKLMDFSIQLGREMQMKSIRLDVFEKNSPAIALYEKSGFKYIDTVDLGLKNYGLNWFRLYEMLL